LPPCFPVLIAWAAAARVLLRFAGFERRSRDSAKVLPFRPHRHDKGFVCNGCREWHPDGMMHCEFV
jgi:hypothetical protein